MEQRLVILQMIYILLGYGTCSCQHGALRLVNGGTSNQGRLEICIYSVWGTVCDASFDANDARVACKQLRYEVDNGQTVSVYYSGQGSGPIWLNSLNCTGTEQNILECSREFELGNPYGCSHSQDVSVVCPANSCTTGAVRLTDGLIATEGTVEVCYNGGWTTVCDSNWGYLEAFVVCRQLGYPATASQSVPYTNSFGSEHSIPTLYNWRCFGNETKLFDCSRSTGSVTTCFSSYYNKYEIAGVKCMGERITSSCSTGNKRLFGPNGPNKVEGRVEYCSNGVWGTVSSSGFDIRDGQVVCKRFGYQQPRALIYINAYFGQGSGPILFSDVSCNGNEFSLDQCGSSNPYSSNHSTDVGVKCMEKAFPDCTNDGSIRLVNGSTPNEGIVEICINGEWGTVCDYAGWDRREANVVCRQLGYTYGSYYIRSKFGDGNLQYVSYYYSCTGSETSLLLCSYNSLYNSNYIHYCFNGHTAGVKCYNSTNCSHGDIKLTGGKSSNEGDVQICVNGAWGYICDWYWYYSNINVVCKQLGYTTTQWNSYSYSSLFGGSQDIAPIVIDDIYCSGNEGTLIECTYYNNYPTCTSVAGAYCADIVNCSNWSIRLTDSETDNEGRVEICTDGIWMTIDAKHYTWSYNESKVVCRQLGYYDQWSVAITDIKWKTKNERIGYTFTCNGNEQFLSNCSVDQTRNYQYLNYWYNSNRGGVECQMNTSTSLCTNNGTVRLSNGNSSNEGRIEICLNGYWGTICSNGWNENDAFVTCKQAGYETLRVIPVYNGYFGKGIGPVHMTNVNCNGNEDSLTQCTYTNGIGVDNCYHGKDVGVICSQDNIVYYKVSILVEKNPVLIGSKVMVDCNISPDPPINITYHWRSTVSGSTITQINPTDSNATITIHSGHPYYGSYYCIVEYNGVTLGRGHTFINVKGILHSTDDTLNTTTTTIGSNVDLTVTLTDTPITDYLLELNWYFNGHKINNNSLKYNIYNNNKSLVITNITEEYYGEYSVRFDGLRLYYYNRNCEQKIIQSLRHYPVLSAVVFKVSFDGIRVIDVDNSNMNINVIGFTKLSTKATLTTYCNEQCDNTTVLVYHNGMISSSGVISGILDPNNNPHIDFTINDPVVLHSGYYEFQYISTPSSILSSLTCDSFYSNFISSQSYLGISNIVKESNVQRLEYYEKPIVNFLANQTSFYSNHNTQLVCSVTGGYPLYYNITLMKNDVSIANTIGSNQLVYSTSNDQIGHKYGLYQCIVDNTVTVFESNMFLKEKADITLKLQVNSCGRWNDSSIEESIKRRAQLSCSCDLIGSVFTNSSQTCSNNILPFSTTLCYATDDGFITASYIIALLMADLNNGKNTSLVIDAQDINIVIDASVMPPRVMFSSGFFTGFFTSICILVIGIVIFVLIFVFVRRKRMKPVQVTEDTTVVRYVSKPSDGSVGYLTPVFTNPKTTKTTTFSKSDPNSPTVTRPPSNKPQASAYASPNNTKTNSSRSDSKPARATHPIPQTSASVSTNTVKSKKVVNQSPLNTSVSVNKKKAKPASTNIVYSNAAPVCELTEEDEDEDEKEIYEEISDNED